jgi:hypothetical protein
LSDPYFRAGVGISTAHICQSNDDAKMLEAAQRWLDEAGYTENTAAELWAIVGEGRSRAGQSDDLADQMAEGMACLMVERLEADYID